MTSDIVKIRKACEIVEAFKKAHVVFVPMPVYDDKDHAILAEVAAQRLEILQRGEK